MHVFICENTPNGILTGVYDAWELKIQERCSHADIYLVSGQPDNYELFCDYHTVAPSAEKAGKVVSTLNRKLGHDFYETILTAILSIDLSGKEEDGQSERRVSDDRCRTLFTKGCPCIGFTE